MSQDIAATISKTTGPISVIRDGQTITLKQGDGVLATDTINTGKESVELSFVDGASAMLSPKTTMTVQEFSADMDAPSFVLNLATGAMRTISGEVVDQNPDAFKIVTPKATVGIRGTTVNTQVKGDGSEVHAVENLSQGHNVTVVAADGTLITITAINQGAMIGAEGDSEVTPYNFTPAEMQQLVGTIVNGLNTLAGDDGDSEGESDSEGDDESDGESDSEGDAEAENEGETEAENNDESDGDTEGEGEAEAEAEADLSVELDQSLINALTDDALSALVAGLEDSGIDVVGLGEDLTNDNGLDSISGDDDEIGEIIDISPVYEDGLLVVSADGSDHFYADSDLTGSVAVNHYLKIEGDGTGSFTYSGDVQSHDSGTLTAGGDRIEAQGMSNGRVVGDANSVGGGTFTGGNDTISIASKTGGNSIYGDVAEVTGGTVSFGNDDITVTGELSSSVAGDALSVSSDATVSKWGDDTISVGSMTGSAKIYGDAETDNSTGNVAGGTNRITVIGEMTDSAQIHGGSGVDNISVATMSSGTIFGNAGTNTISITEVTGSSTINGGGNVDKITIGSMNGYRIDAGSGNDSIKIATMLGGEVLGGLGEDTIRSGDMSDGSLLGGSDDDTIIVGNISAGGVMGGTQDDTITAGNMTAGVLEGGAGSDTISAGAMSGGSSIRAAEGSDREDIGNKVTVTSMADTASITGDNGADTIEVGTLNGTGAIIDGVGGNDSVKVVNLQAGSINDSGGDNTIIITNMSGGAVNLGAGNDSVQVNSWSGGTIDGGAGTDTLNLTGTVTTTVDMSTGNFEEYIFNNIGDGAVINGTANADTIKVIKFTVASYNEDATINTFAGNDVVSFESSANYSDMTINNSAGTDTIKIGSLSYSSVTLTGDGSFTLQNFAGESTLSASVKYEGSQALSVGTVTYGSITTGDAGHSIDVTNLQDKGIISGGAGNDIISVGNFTTLDSSYEASAYIYAGDGNDTINIGTLDLINDYRQYVSGSSGDDVYNITTMTKGSIDDRSSDTGDTFNITGSMVGGAIETGAGADSFTIKNLEDGTIKSGAGNDDITVNIDTSIVSDSGMFESGDGDDTITINGTIKFAYINSGADNDTIDLETVDNARIRGGDGDDTIIVDNLNGFIDFYGEAGNDSIKIGTMSSGTSSSSAPIYANEGNDIIEIDSLMSGKIDGGADDGAADIDTLVINNAFEGLATISNMENVFLGAGINRGTLNINKDSAIGVNLAASYTVEGGYTGFDMLENTDEGYSLSGSIYTSNATDNIYINNMVKGSIYANGGNDDINITGEMSGGTVNAGAGNDDIDIASMSDGTVKGDAGDDSIDIVTMSGGTVDGGVDASQDTLTIGTLSGTENVFKNLKKVIINNELADGVTYETENVGEVWIAGVLHNTYYSLSSGEVNGGDGADVITIEYDMSGGTINTITGADTISIGNDMSGGTINAGADNDDISVTRNAKTNAIINGDAGADSISIDNYLMNSAQINGGADADTITVKYMSGGTINGDDGADTTITGDDIITITENKTGGIINGGAGTDSITITKNMGNSATTINGGAGNDTITISGTLEGGSIINADAGDDSIQINVLEQGVIDGGEGTDTLTIDSDIAISYNNTISGMENVFLTSGMSNGNLFINSDSGENVTIAKNSSNEGFALGGNFITTGSGNDTFHVATMSGGNINGEAGDDNINIATMSGGTVNAGDGNDDITIATMTTGTIDGGTGDDDTLSVTNAVDASGQTMDINNVEKVLFSGGVTNGYININTYPINASVTVAGSLKGDGSVSSGFDISGGLVSTGQAADNIYINEFSGGQVATGDGNDNITVSTFTGTASAGEHYINGLDGTDNLTITSAIDTSNSVVVYNMENVLLNGGVINGSVKLNDGTTLAGVNVAGSSDGSGGFDGFDISGGSVFTSDTVDNIIIGTLGQAIINTGAGADNITIQDDITVAMDTQKYIINTTGSVDTVNVLGSITSSGVLNLAGSGGFVVNLNQSGKSLAGTISGSADADIFNINIMSGTIAGNSGDDIFNIGTMSGGTVIGGVGTDELHIGKLTGNVTFTDVEKVEIDIVDGGSYTLNNVGEVWIGGELQGKNEEIAGLEDETIDGTTAADTFNVTGAMIDSTINSGDGDDQLSVNNMASGTINAGNGSDRIDITTMASGTINGGGGDNTITVYEMSSGTVDIGESGSNEAIITLASNETDTSLMPKVVCGANSADDISLNAKSGLTMVSVNLSGFTIGQDTLRLGTWDIDPSTTTFKEINNTNVTYTLRTAMSESPNKNIFIEIGGVTYNLYLENSIVLNNTPFTMTANVDTFAAEDGAQSIVISGESVASGDSVAGDKTSSGGDDNFTIGSNITGGEIYGDFASATASHSLGHDRINVTATTFNAGAIYGDAKTTSHNTSGQDVITVANMAGTAEIYGDFQDTSSVAGSADKIIVTGTMSGGSIYGGAGDDTIEVQGYLQGGSISGDDGNDNIIVNNISVNSVINGGAGDDIINITNMMQDSSSIDGGEGNDQITIGTLDSALASVQANNGSDIIKITTMNDGTVYAGAGDTDKIYITNMNSGTIDGGEGTDEIFITTMANGSVYGDNSSGAQITGEDKETDDKITITSMTGGTIVGGDGKDEIFITDISKGIIYAGLMDATKLDGADDKIILQNITNTTQDDIKIYASDGKDQIELSSSTADAKVTIYDFDFSEENGDSLNVNGDSYDGEDTVTIAGGSDTITLSSVTNQTINFDGILVTFASS